MLHWRIRALFFQPSKLQHLGERALRAGMELRKTAFLGIKLECVFHCFSSSLSLSSLFPEYGWHRNPSKAFYQAFQSGSRLRDSKAHSDRYSTILDWTGQACKSVTMCVQCSVAASFAFSTCMDWVWKQSLAASAGLANRLLNNIYVSLCYFPQPLSLSLGLLTLSLYILPLKNSVLFTAWRLLP